MLPAPSLLLVRLGEGKNVVSFLGELYSFLLLDISVRWCGVVEEQCGSVSVLFCVATVAGYPTELRNQVAIYPRRLLKSFRSNKHPVRMSPFPKNYLL